MPEDASGRSFGARSLAVQRAAGAEARRRVPPEVFAGWRPDPARPDPVAQLLSQAADRIPELVPIRHGRMAAGAFPFLRGAALPMASDLARLPTTGIDVQLCGDAHLCNFGLFDSPERNLVFDINDFDESWPGPWEWDLLRLAASIAVAARSRSFSAHAGRHAVRSAVRSYAGRMHEYAAMRAIDVYYARVDAARILAFVKRKGRAAIEATIRSANTHDALHELPKLTTGSGLDRRIVDRPPVITHPENMTSPVIAATLDLYRSTLQEDRRILLDRYQPVDAALKVVGVGSVGLGAWALLMLGADDDDPLFLQVKESTDSVLAAFVPGDRGHNGERIVRGQRRLQAVSDVLLGWTTGPLGRPLYVRQLKDAKGSPVIETMSESDLADWAALCGWALARGHARSGQPSAIAAYIGQDEGLSDAAAAFAATYADQTERDHQALLDAIRSGRVQADPGT